MHTEMEKIGYYWTVTEYLDTTFQKSKDTKHHATCCATYVSWVLQEAGIISDSEHFDCATDVYLLKNGFKKYSEGDKELQPGDIIIYQPGSPHIDIYVGNGKKLNAGHDVNQSYGHYDNFVSSCNSWSTYNFYRLEK